MDSTTSDLPAETLYPSTISGMVIKIEDIPFGATQWELKQAFASILHGPEFYSPDAVKARPINFDIVLQHAYNGLPNNGKGKLVLPDYEMGKNFLWWVFRGGSPGVYIGRRKLYLSRSDEKPPRGHIEALNKRPYVDPKAEQEREWKLGRIDQIRIILDAVQLGVFFRRSDDSAKANRTFSNEFEIRRERTFAGELVLDYNHKLLRVQMADYVSDDMSQNIVIDLANIRKSACGSEPGKGPSYICLELWAPPTFERTQTLRAYSGDKQKDRKAKFRDRLPHLGGAHETITQYAYQIRLVLNDHKSRHDFKKLCEEAGIRIPSKTNIDVVNNGFFRPNVLKGVREWMLTFDWPVRFQIEALLRNGLVNTGDLFAIREDLQDLAAKRPTLVAGMLRRLSEKLKTRNSGETVFACFKAHKEAEAEDADSLEESDLDSPRPMGSVECAHVIVTPSRILLEGPYDTKSNRIVRKYYEYRDQFIRVEFRDENRMTLRWPREVNGRLLIEQRYGDILKKGVEIAGRKFYFLGYSNSGLGEHTAWFMAEFEHPDEGLVTPDKIRADLGDFSECAKQPSKYAARIAQAFSGTDPSVRIRPEHWEFVENGDLGEKPHEHTDGQGTISPGLRDMIWKVLTAAWSETKKDTLKPSAYQIRFLGFKGVVVVDEQLKGIFMRLRPSMKKYNATMTGEAEIEIAKAFIKPGPARLCRPLITVLEDRGVRKEAFIALQETAKRKVIKAPDTITDTVNALLRQQDLGNTFGLRWILQYLEGAGMGMPRQTSPRPAYVMDNDFIKRLLKCAQAYILHEFKHDARIPIENAHQLVGVVDEGPAYIKEGRFREEEVLCLEEGQIFACVQQPDDPDTIHYIQGHVSISRSPHIHPGDVQVVYAVGKPPEDGRICFFRNIKNVVVMPSVGKRSLASCLAGGDVDGDEFLVIKDGSLLPTEHTEPAQYDTGDVQPRLLDRPSTVADICDFFVEYMQSHVVGLVSDQHLVTADQSKYGTFDRDCMTLARLCSQAVDYPKNGVPVDMEKIPPLHIRTKPDWKKADDNDGQPGDFYESTRALGELFRNIKMEPLQLSTSSFMDGEPLAPTHEPPLSDAISACLRRPVGDALGRIRNDEEALDALEPLFRYYVRELGYICLTHAPADTMDVRLSEEEIVVGVILAKSSLPRWKKDRMYRMREHSRQLVRDVKYRRRGFGVPFKRDKDSRRKGKEQDREQGEGEGEYGVDVDTDEGAPREELLAALAKGWAAWDLGMRRRGVFGARSFGLIGLGVVCDMLEQLEP